MLVGLVSDTGVLSLLDRKSMQLAGDPIDTQLSSVTAFAFDGMAGTRHLSLIHTLRF